MKAPTTGELAEVLLLDLVAKLQSGAKGQAAVTDALPALMRLHELLDIVLGPRQPATEGAGQASAIPAERMLADEIFDEGIDLWLAGDRTKAVRRLKAALKHWPQHADALVHLGVDAREKGRLAQAESLFLAAVEGGRSDLVVMEDGTAPWGILENRPTLRALGNLALLRREQGQWDELLRLQLQMLALNPNDNQGVRYQMGHTFLRLGQRAKARQAYARGAQDDAGCAYGLALTAFQGKGAPSAPIEALLLGLAQNRYVPDLLLKRPLLKLDAWHESNLAEPEHAQFIADDLLGLWEACPGAISWLKGCVEAPALLRWRRQLDEAMVAMKGAQSQEERSKLWDQMAALRSPKRLKALAAEVLKGQE